MHTGKHLPAILLCLVFLAGIIAPVPECYVTGVVCPLKKSILAARLPAKGAPSLSGVPPCCATTKNPPDAAHSQCPVSALKSGMKSYAPAFETAEAPIAPFALLPALFFKPAPQPAVVFIAGDGKRQALPDPIPILLRKQSFLI